MSLLTTNSLPASDSLEPIQAAKAYLLFIPLAAVLAIAATLWGLFNPQHKRRMSWVIRLAGLIGLAYFVQYGLQDRQNTTAALIQSP